MVQHRFFVTDRTNNRSSDAEKVGQLVIGQQHCLHRPGSVNHPVQLGVNPPKSVFKCLRMFHQPSWNVLHLLRVRDTEGGHRSERAPWNPSAAPPDLGRVLRSILSAVVREGLPGVHRGRSQRHNQSQRIFEVKIAAIFSNILLTGFSRTLLKFQMHYHFAICHITSVYTHTRDRIGTCTKYKHYCNRPKTKNG